MRVLFRSTHSHSRGRGKVPAAVPVGDFGVEAVFSHLEGSLLHQRVAAGAEALLGDEHGAGNDRSEYPDGEESTQQGGATTDKRRRARRGIGNGARRERGGK